MSRKKKPQDDEFEKRNRAAEFLGRYISAYSNLQRSIKEFEEAKKAYEDEISKLDT